MSGRQTRVAAIEIADGEGNPLVGQQCRCVGQKIDLKAHIAPAGVFDEPSYEWTIPGETIKDYVVHDEQKSSEVLPLTEDQLESDAIDFYWVDGAQEREVNLVVKIDGLTFTDVVGFEVQAPTLNSFTSDTGDVSVDWVPQYEEWKLRSGKYGQNYGISWEAFVTSPDGFGGAYKYVQVVQANLAYIRYDDSTESLVIGPDWWLDVADPIGNGFFEATYAAGEGGRVPTNPTMIPSDTPAFRLRRPSEDQGWKRVENQSCSFQLFLMFSPEIDGTSIAVPVGKLIWGWQGIGETSDAGVNYSLVSGDHCQHDPIGTTTCDFPVWQDRRIPGYPVTPSP